MPPSFAVTVALFVGLVLTFLGERVVDPGTTRWVVSGLGTALAVASLVVRALRLKAAAGDRKVVEQALLGLGAVALAGVVLYFAQSDLLTRLDGKSLEQSSPKLAGVLGALWPALIATAVIPTFFMELAYSSMTRAPQVERGRVRDAMLSGLGLAWALVFVFALMYVVTERDTKWDLSRFRTAKPGEATIKVVQGLDQPVNVLLFFPPANEVAEQVTAYFDSLTRLNDKLKVERLDHALEPTRARNLGVSGNGVVLISRGDHREQLFVGTELEKARSQLRNLDAELQKKILQVARTRKPVYFIAGHGELSETPEGPADQRATLRELRAQLRALNYELRPLTVAEGLGSEIPKDAGAVLLIGPSSDLQQPEIDTLAAYFKKGGRVLIALDPETKLDFKSLLAPYGLSFAPTILANDVAFARRSGQPSDRTIIGTNTYSSHPSVSTLGRVQQPVFLIAAGALDDLPARPGDMPMDFSVRAHPQTWNDLDGDFNHASPEVRRAYPLVAAVTYKQTAPAGGGPTPPEGRAVILGDADVLGDFVMTQSRGNALFAIDQIKWLIGDEAISGTTNVETDAPIQRDRRKDQFWFYSTIFLGPAAVVLAGWAATRRRGIKRSKSEASR
jgi:hypothetical protein